MNAMVAEGQIVCVEGCEFVASDVRYIELNGSLTLRFVGTCTDSPRNDAIRGTSYNGGVYGWRVDPSLLSA